jgi:hypothetical protein
MTKWYERVSETEEWHSFDNFMALLWRLKVLSQEQYQDFPDRAFIKYLLAELKDMHDFKRHHDYSKRKRSKI